MAKQSVDPPAFLPEAHVHDRSRYIIVPGDIREKILNFDDVEKNLIADSVQEGLAWCWQPAES